VQVKEKNALKNKKIGFIGGGNMAEALIRGLVAGGVSPSRLSVSDPLTAKREYLVDRYGVHVTTDNWAVASGCDILVLAIKPQVADSVLAQIDGAFSAKTLLVSIMAGVTCATIEGLFSKPVRLVRVMPNTPALVLQAASALSPGSNAGDDDLLLAEAIFSPVGTTCRVNEKLLDAVTGLSGSGPAYVLTFIEALADGGVKNGLPRDTALALAAQTVAGTAQLLLQTGEHPAALRDKVTSPGGTTIAGIHALEQGAFRATVLNAVDAATARAYELGKK
jgi:pyrroline-5-carboxylate reductase